MQSKIISLLCAAVLCLSGCIQKTDPAENIPQQVASVIEENEIVDESVSLTGNEIIDETTMLFADDDALFARAKEIADQMSLEEKTGQIFFVRFPESGVLEEIEEYSPGGYIVFGRDFENSTPAEFKNTIEACQKTSGIPLLIGVDEEGGRVVRASKYPQFRAESFKSPRELYAEGQMEAVEADAVEKSRFLKSLGINVNLAPVCDISSDPDNFMYERSIGLDADGTSLYAVTVQNAMRENGMGSVLKHFPGYGDNADTHEGESRDTRSLEYLSENDLVPFAAAIENGCDAILVSHNIIEAIDGENPATLSTGVHEFLRNEMGFEGVIVTDDMSMGALEGIDIGDAAVKAVLSGNDLIITSDLQTQYNAVLQAMKSGEIGDNRIDEAVCRVLLWKLKLGIIE